MASVYREVKNFQDDLKQAGMYDGPITGRYDAATHEAAKKMVASGKLGDPVEVPEPTEDTYGSIVGAIAREMRFSDGAAEAIRTAYSEWAREVQSKPLSGFGDFGAAAAPAVRMPTTAARTVAVPTTGTATAVKTAVAPTAVRTAAVAPAVRTPVVAPATSVRPVAVPITTPTRVSTPVTAPVRTPASKTPVPAAGGTFTPVASGAVQERPVTQAQAVVVAQTLLKQAGLYTGALDGNYSAAVETAFQSWATRNNTTIVKYLASAGQPLVKAALTAARNAFLAGGRTFTPAPTPTSPPVTVSQTQAVQALQLILQKAKLYMGPADGVYNGLVEYGFQTWATSTRTTIEAYLASPNLPLIKAGISAARRAFLAAGGTATPPYTGGTGTGATATVTPQKAVTDLQAVLAKAGFISGTPDGIYNADLEIAFGNWAASTGTNIDAFLASAPGPYKIGIKAARDAYLSAGGVAYPAGIANAPGVTGTTGTATTTTTDTTGTTTTTTTTDTGTTATTSQDQGWYSGGGGGGGGSGRSSYTDEEAPPQTEEGAAPVPADQAIVKAGDAPVVPPKSNTLRYVVIAGVLVAAGGAAWWYWKKRKAASAVMSEGLDGLDEEVVETTGE